MVGRRELTREKLQQQYAKKSQAITHHETIVRREKARKFWNKSRLAMATLTLAAMTWIVSESMRLVIDRSIPAKNQTSITLGIILLIVLLILVASNFAT